MKEIELVGLPKDCTVVWSHLYENAEDHIHDEDITYIKLANGIQVDAGQYGDPSFFRVVVVPATGDKPKIRWHEVETSICRTTQEVAAEIVRLANKYNDDWYAGIVNGFYHDDEE